MREVPKVSLKKYTITFNLMLRITYLSEETKCVTKHCTSILGPIAWACRAESYH